MSKLYEWGDHEKHRLISGAVLNIVRSAFGGRVNEVYTHAERLARETCLPSDDPALTLIARSRHRDATIEVNPIWLTSQDTLRVLMFVVTIVHVGFQGCFSIQLEASANASQWLPKSMQVVSSGGDLVGLMELLTEVQTAALRF